MNRKEKIESITQHEDRNKLDWDDNVLVQPEEGEGSGKNGTERKHFKMSLRKLAPDTDWSEPTDDTPPSGKLVKDSLEQIELTPGPQGIQGEEGDSAYEVAVKEGFVGDETAWLASLKGADGSQGVQGQKGEDGEQGPPGNDGDSAYEIAVKEGFVGDETAWLASLKGADGQDGAKGADGEQGEEGKSAYDIYVETTSDSPVKTEEQWLASLKGADGEQGADGDSAYDIAVHEGFSGTEQEWLDSLKGTDGAKGEDGKSAYEYAGDEGYTGTEQEFAEALADVENKVDKSKIVTTWNSPKNDEVPSAKLVHESLNGGGGEDITYRKGVVVIGSATEVSVGRADRSWEQITADNETWKSFWNDMHNMSLIVRFLKGEFVVPPEIYYFENDSGPVAFPSGATKIEGSGEETVIRVGYPAGGTVMLSVEVAFGGGPAYSAPAYINNLKIVNTAMTTFGVAFGNKNSTGSVVENVIVEDMVGVGIVCSNGVEDVKIHNCTTINCGSPYAGQEAAGIGVSMLDSRAPSNITIEDCTVIGGAYAGIGIVNAEDCKVVNCHVEDYGAIGAGAIGGKRNIFANNTIIRDTQANPQAGEFGILLNETDRAIVVGNIVENASIMNNDSNDCVIENNIGDVL